MTLAHMDERVKAVLLGDVEGMQRFLREQAARKQEAEAEDRRRAALFEADPFDPEAQRRIEEEIHRAAQNEAYERAVEEAPECVGDAKRCASR